MSSEKNTFGAQIGVQEERVDNLGGRMDRFENRFNSFSDEIKGMHQTDRESSERWRTQFRREVNDGFTRLTNEIKAMREQSVQDHRELNRYVNKEVRPIVEEVHQLKGRFVAYVSVLSLALTVIATLLSNTVGAWVTSGEPSSAGEPSQQVLYVDPRRNSGLENYSRGQHPRQGYSSWQQRVMQDTSSVR